MPPMKCKAVMNELDGIYITDNDVIEIQGDNEDDE